MSFLGVLWGLGYFLVAAGHFLVIIPLLRISTVGALITAPVWSALESVYLWKLYKRP